MNHDDETPLVRLGHGEYRRDYHDEDFGRARCVPWWCALVLLVMQAALVLALLACVFGGGQ